MSGPGEGPRPIDAGRFREVKEALLRARELDAAGRSEFLRSLGERDAALRSEVESLLSAEAAPAPIVETGVVAALGIGVPGPGPDLPERIGPYRIRAVLGEGGMGIVYRAEQDEPIRREVALKVIRSLYAPRSVVSRFDAERQALAMMNHPNIAMVFDAGTDDAGNPWFSMELVPGVPITRFCDEQRLDTRARLELFLLLCDAIQHAHQKGVIHRDLKPSNVLVAGGTGGPVLKVIDFGIAKALDSVAAESDGLTRTGHVVGTPSYMSPEQAGLVDAPVDTRSDVYALGVLLYELLCGTRPFPFTEESLSPAELLRAQSEEEPARPSTRVRPKGERAPSAETVAEARRTSAARLHRDLSGDLDNVVLCALRREPDRRYASVERFAADVRNHLAGRPVAARPATWRYRTGKFVRRHRGGVAVAVVAVVLVIGFVVALVVQSAHLADERNRAVAAEHEARASAERAEHEAAVSRETSEFLSGLFDDADPDQSGGRSLTARQLLDRGERRLDTELLDQPAVRARLKVVLGGVYEMLADYDRTKVLAESALVIQRAQPVPNDEDLSATLELLTNLAHDRRDMKASAAYARENVEVSRRHFGEASAEFAHSLSTLAVPLRAMGQYAEAESLLRAAIVLDRKYLPPDHPDLAWDINLLGYTRYSRGDVEEAERYFREAYEIQRRTLKPPHSDLATALNNIGGISLVRGRAREAERAYRESIDMYRALYGEDHPAMTRGYNSLGGVLREEGRDAEAEALVRRALGINLRLFGPGHEFVANTLGSLAAIRRDRGDFAGADSCLRAAMAIRSQHAGEDAERQRATLDMSRAELALDRGDPETARRLAESAVPVLESLLPAEEMRLVRSKLLLGVTRTRTGHADQAEPLLRGTLATLERVLPSDSWRIPEARSALGACLHVLGKDTEARPLLESGARDLRAALGPDDQRVKLAEARKARAGIS